MAVAISYQNVIKTMFLSLIRNLLDFFFFSMLKLDVSNSGDTQKEKK